MRRKFVSIVPLKEDGRSGLWLYAIADDGSAWRARQLYDGTLTDDGWEEVQELPEADQRSY